LRDARHRKKHFRRFVRKTGAGAPASPALGSVIED
jgi:hypothetical protein